MCVPGAVPARRLSVVILERAGITHSGPGDELTELCPAVQELSLGGNSISGWETVSQPNYHVFLCVLIRDYIPCILWYVLSLVLIELVYSNSPGLDHRVFNASASNA